jgi:stearoyl-CoA desaturase (Delta-9 desaturase)
VTSAPLKSPPQPVVDEALRPLSEQVWLTIFVAVPFLAMLAAVPLMWGRWLSWLDIGLAAVMYVVAGFGITVGYHRYFTHGSFKAKPWLHYGLAVAGSLAIEGPVIRWVANHRRHHAFSDRDGDPHSPWRYGNNLTGLVKGLLWAHLGWMWNREQTNQRKFAPDLIQDAGLQRISRAFNGFVAVSLLLPAALGGLLSWSWQGALTAFFWASLVRVGLLHHVTWSINSICHALGNRPFKTNGADRSVNVWWLAVLSLGESWHNLHHADPTCARHGVLQGQIDSSARLIWLFERFGWAYNVRWPNLNRLERRAG